MRLAYLILAHNNPIQLKRLISRLNNDHTVIFIHLDKNAKDTYLFTDIANCFKNCQFIKHQVPVKWGAFSMVQATLNGLDEIIRFDDTIDYINLLSGADYPIKAGEDIYNFFSRNNGKEFLYVRQSPSPDLPLGGIDRYEYYYDYDSQVYNRNEYEVEMRQRNIKRNYIHGMKPYHGSQWWSLTGKCIKYILNYVNENKEITNFYRYTKFSDEQFFQTIVMNSQYSSNVTNENLHYIDWSHIDWSKIDWVKNLPHPKVLTLSDFHMILRSNKLFARKFDENIDSNILNLIDSSILKNPENAGPVFYSKEQQPAMSNHLYMGNKGVSIITIASDLSSAVKIFTNYMQQNMVKKELLIIINNDLDNFDQWVFLSKLYPMVRVYQQGVGTPVKECYNYGIERSIFEYIALFHEEHYYDPEYLSRSIEKLISTNTDWTGRKPIISDMGI